MWTVVDWADTKIIGTFETRQQAVQWLVEKGYKDGELDITIEPIQNHKTFVIDETK